jgi:cyclopropane fatty-acyl-phospholipid synthase-like methyltransferase
MTKIPPLPVHAWLRYDAIQRLLGHVNPRTVLEIGVGQGSLGVMLAERFDYVGIDLDEGAISIARRRFDRYGLDARQLVHGGLAQVSDRQFDLVCAFEVLEHFEDDRATLDDWFTFVTPGGALLLSVPAGPERFAAADEKAGHFRRYGRADIESILDSAGFTDVRILNYGVPAGYMLEAARNVLAKRDLRRHRTYQERTLASGRWLQPPEWAGSITRLVAAPLSLVQRPFMHCDRGTGLVALAKRG